MNNISNIVIVGGVNGNPALFEAQVNPVKLGKDYEVCVSSLYHGEVYNIHDGNNKVYFYHGNRLDIERVKQIRGKSAILIPSTGREAAELYNRSILKTITIPQGNYASSISLFGTIANLIRDTLGLTKKRDAMNPTMDKQYDVITVELTGLYLLIEGKPDTPWSLLKLYKDQYENFTVQNMDLRCTEFPAMIYTNIIENSYVNGKLLRNFGVVPITNHLGWTFYKPANPYYAPITVREFSKIVIVLRDINDNYIKFNPLYKTVITLNIRPIKGNNSVTL